MMIVQKTENLCNNRQPDVHTEMLCTGKLNNIAALEIIIVKSY